MTRKEPIRVPLNEQLLVLAECGISLAASVTPDVLTRSLSRESYEGEPYRLLLCIMGAETEAELHAGLATYPSDNIWHFDTESIEDQGSYAAIAQRMAVLAQGDLPLERVEDYVDLEGEEAWLSFSLDGRPYKWHATVDDDWVDPSILTQFTELLDSRKTLKRFTYIDLAGQDCLIGCATSEQRAFLEFRTGLKVDWLR